MPAATFGASYAAALTAHLEEPTEATLNAAYELAREALVGHLSVLDLAGAHQEAMLSALARASDAEDARRIVRRAGDLFLEGLAAYEMVQRGFEEARQTALHERRQTELARRLSTFLADASLALDAHGSLEEMLQLVAEQARELIGAECSVATLFEEGGGRRALQAASHAATGRRWTSLLRWLDVPADSAHVQRGGGSVREAGAAVAHRFAYADAGDGRVPQTWLAASLTALDGTQVGMVQLFDKEDGAFTAEDEASLVHLAQMASAAVERAQHYRRR
jgi:Phosphoserine phosphatase RsbU, N-terminal domain